MKISFIIHILADVQVFSGSVMKLDKRINSWREWQDDDRTFEAMKPASTSDG
jgi:hypothetical protein